jgi:hypothetical protein
MSDEPRADDPRDPALRERFAELGRDDASRAPSFASMWRPRPRKIVSAWWVAAPAVSFAAAAAALLIWVAAPRKLDRAPVARATVVATAPAPTAPPGPDLRVAIQSDPLGFLLDTPSLASVPDFDSDPRRRP